MVPASWGAQRGRRSGAGRRNERTLGSTHGVVGGERTRGGRLNLDGARRCRTDAAALALPLPRLLTPVPARFWADAARWPRLSCGGTRRSLHTPKTLPQPAGAPTPDTATGRCDPGVCRSAHRDWPPPAEPETPITGGERRHTHPPEQHRALGRLFLLSSAGHGNPVPCPLVGIDTLK